MATQTTFDENDVLNLYKKSFNIKIPFHSVLDNGFCEWLELFEKSTNCSKSLVLSSIISLTAVLCGPKTEVSTGAGEFHNSLNEYLIAICDPGGGKSNTFNRVIQPVIDNIQRRHHVHIHLENYTTAGIQKHQVENKGYGLITGDEGQRFLSSIPMKQSKGEAEKAFLCKLWGGRGDSNILANGTRGFDKTSMSACIFIQPEPLLHELKNLRGNDGLLDRFLFISAKPIFHKCQVIRENYTKLCDTNMKDFVNLFEKIYTDHKAGSTYVLSEDAQRCYEEMVDSYADYISDKYADDDDKENSITIESSQDAEVHPSYTTSKDTLHILRLATILHIIQHYANCILRGENTTNIPIEIPVSRLQQSKTLYNVIVQHRATYLQALANDTGRKVSLKPSLTLQEKIIRSICKSCGPVVNIRHLQRHLKGVLSDTIKVELEELQRAGFGELKKIRNSNVFFKLPGSLIDEEIGPHTNYIKIAGQDVANYHAHFCDITKLNTEMIAICRQHHPHIEILLAENIL